MPEHDAVNHPRHYAAHPRFTIECIELTRLMSFDGDNALKYMWRHTQKNGPEDLAKAEWYMQDLIDHSPMQVWLSPAARRQAIAIFDAHVRPHLVQDDRTDAAIAYLLAMP